MGDPYFKVKPQLIRHRVAVFSSNDPLYGAMSQRVVHTLEQLAPTVEVYSIDEAFLELGGFAEGAVTAAGVVIDPSREYTGQEARHRNAPSGLAGSDAFFLMQGDHTGLEIDVRNLRPQQLASPGTCMSARANRWVKEWMRCCLTDGHQELGKLVGGQVKTPPEFFFFNDPTQS
jgi:nucleotidyltransferase/DNA polymerase involved in DNA repair